MGVTSESHIDTGLDGFFRDNLCAARADDHLVSDTFFHAELVQSLHVLVVNIVVGNDCGSKDCLCVFFDTSVNHLFYRYGSAEVYAFDTPLFDTAMFDVNDFSHTYGVFVFADCTADNLHVFVPFEFIIKLFICHIVWLRRDLKGRQVDIEINAALQFDSGTFRILHHFCRDNFRVNQT